MTFNSDFWTTIGAAAPVIALSCILLINDQGAVMGNKMITEKAFITGTPISAYRAARVSYWINGANLATQVAMFSYALDGLATRKSPLAEETATAIEAFSLFLLFFSTASIVAAKTNTKKYENTLLASRNTRDRRPYYVRRKIQSIGFRNRANLAGQPLNMTRHKRKPPQSRRH